MVEERIGMKSKWIINKFKDPTGEIAEFLRNGGSIEEAARRFGTQPITNVFEGNVALNEGLQLLIDIITGRDTTSAKWDSTNARLGVGDGTTAENATQTGLQGTNKAFKAMDTGYPTRTNQTATWRATFGGTEANFSWREFTVVNAADDNGKNLNRKVVDKGTKASGETWTLELQITFS